MEEEQEKVLLTIKWWMKKYKEKKQKVKNCEWYNSQFFLNEIYIFEICERSNFCKIWKNIVFPVSVLIQRKYFKQKQVLH